MSFNSLSRYFWSLVHKHVMNRKVYAPEIEQGSVCDILGCEEPATEQWMPSLCSLREADIKISWVNVCSYHDFEINQKMVKFFFGDKYDEALTRYKETRLAGTQASSNGNKTS